MLKKKTLYFIFFCNDIVFSIAALMSEPIASRFAFLGVLLSLDVLHGLLV